MAAKTNFGSREDLISDLEARDPRANGLDLSRQLLSQDLRSRRPQEAGVNPQREPDPEWKSETSQLTVTGDDRRRVNLD